MVNKLPQGCDQQGRHPEAAEAATDLGIEEPEDDSLRVVIDDVLLALAGIAAICIVVLTALGVWG
jgi:hypothetical protein